MGSPAKYSFVILLACLVLPRFALAQVVVNEIMYNPAGTDTGREWIELYNAGSADSTLVGGSGKGSWRIGDGSNHTITDPAGGTGRGTLTVPAGGYLILASDPTEFLSGEYAGGTYAVAKASLSLSNTGTTVALLDGSGSTVDSVTYSKDQGASDDGAGLQRQPDGSWIAGLPTPGAANTATAYTAPQTPTDTGSTTTTSDSSGSDASSTPVKSAPVSSYVPPPVPTLFADGGDDRTVIVGADTEFDGRAYDRDDETLDHVRFLWNFGDGSTGEGPAVLHHYQYPGRYEIVLTIAENREAVSDRIIVTAEPAQLSFASNPDGSVSIENRAGRDLDLSSWIVTSFAERFTLPENSILLSGATLRIPQTTLGFYAGAQTELDYPNGVRALSTGQSSGTATTSNPIISMTAAPAAAVNPAAKPAIRASAPAHPAVTIKAAAKVPAGEASDTPSTTPLRSQSAAAGAAFGASPWWLAVLALALLAAGVAAYVKHQRASEWDIAEIE